MCSFFSFGLNQVGLSSFGPLSCSPRQEYTLPRSSPLPPPPFLNDGNQFSQEIRTPMTSRACSPGIISSHLNDRQKQKKISAPSCLPLKSRWESALMPSPICAAVSFIDALFFFGGGGGGRLDRQGGCSGSEQRSGWGIVPVPWMKPPLYSSPLPPCFFGFFPLASGTIIKKKRADE